MKKIILILFILVISVPGFANLKSKHLVGKWKYVITLYNGQNEGSFVFSQKKGELKGEVIQPDGSVFPLSKIKVNKKRPLRSFILYLF